MDFDEFLDNWAWDNQFDLLFRWNMIHIEEFTENEND